MSSSIPEVDSNETNVLVVGGQSEPGGISSPNSRYYGSPPGTALSYSPSRRIPKQKEGSVFLSYDDTNPETVQKVRVLKSRLKAAGKSVICNTVCLL